MARSLKRGGLSLLETIFSVFLVGLAILFILELFPGSLLAERRASQRAQAGNLAQSLVHELLAVPFAQLEVGVEQLEPVVAAQLEFRATREVFVVGSAAPENALGIRAVVTWTERGRDFSVMREQVVARID